MEITMSKFTSLIRRAPKRFSALVAIVAAAIIVPIAVNAYGPTDRATFTFKDPAPYVTFNSITDNPSVGDERNFVRIKEDSTTTTYGEDATLLPGKTYQVMVYYHNNAKTSLNESGKGIAKDVSLRMQVPGSLAANASDTVDGFINASNANPTSVWDSANVKNGSNGAIAIRYVPNSATVTSNGKVNGKTLPDSFLTTGAKLGYDALDGTIPGCNQYAGYVVFKITVDQPNFNVEKEVSVDGGKTYGKTATTTPGSTVQYRVSYQNTGTTQQDGVELSDKLPAGVSYVNGSSYIANSKTKGEYEKTSDGITTTGLNVGSYAPKGNVYFKFQATVPSKEELKCGTNTFVNTARATTSGGYKEDTATVTIKKDCTPPPAKITVCELSTKKIISIYEKDFDAKKYSKDLNDCKEKPPVTITVCELATKKIVTINEKDFDASKHSKNLDDCKTPEKINVCELSTKQIVSIDEKDFDSAKYSKNLDDCKTTPPATIVVCDLTSKQTVTINESDFDASKYSKDLNACKETPTTPPELPHTGMSENIVAIVGLGALIASIAYYAASRRALNQ